MNFKRFKSIVSACLVAAIMLAPANVSLIAQDNPASTSAYGQQNAAVIKNKSEVIYATLASNGDVTSAYAVNHFELSQAGTVKDYGRYAKVVNLTSTDPLLHHEDSVSFHAEKENFYYQGNMATTDLPWKFEIAYYFNGVKTLPQDIAGKSGELEITIATSQNEKIDPTFYEHYMLQISLTLNTENCSNITALDAVTARAGKDLVIVHTVMPKSDGDIRVTATVKDFTMEGTEIAAVPFSMNVDLSEMDDMVDDFQKLSDAISALHDGVGELTYGVAEFRAGAGELKDGSAEFKKGLAQISGHSEQLTGASAQINAALSQIATSVGSDLSSEMGLNDLAQLPQGLTQLAQGLKEISGGLTELGDGFSLAYTALNTAMKGIPDAPLTQEQIEVLYANTHPDQHALLGQLVESYAAGQIAAATYSQVKGAFDAVEPTMNTLSGSIETISRMLDDISENIKDELSGMDVREQINQLSAGLSDLSTNYADFHNGLTDYVDGVNGLAAGHAEFHTGVVSFNDGAGELHDGVLELHNGMKLLNNETADMPDMIKSEIDDLLGQYKGEDFGPISFTSPQNENTGFVQFVVKSDGIEKYQEAVDLTGETKNDTIWDRFLALFTKRN